MDLLLLNGRLENLRAAIQDGGTHTAQWRRLYEQCEWYRVQPDPPKEPPLESITYFGLAAMNLALAYKLTGHREYLGEFWRWTGTAVSYPHWGRARLPDHDLDAGWLLHGLSLAYSWLREDLPADQSNQLRDKLILQGERMYDYAVEKQGEPWPSSFWQNHNWIDHNGLATAGYALGRTEWTEQAKTNFATVLEVMTDEGSDYEGPVYWRYGVLWLAAYVNLLENVEGADWWHRFDFMRNTFKWRIQQCAPGYELNVEHGDCHDRRSSHSVALYYKLASAYRIGEAQWMANLVADKFFWREQYQSGVLPGVMPEAAYELLWYDPTVSPVDPATTTPTTAYFPDLGQINTRTGWGADATLVSFKAAPGGGHKAWDRAEWYRRERGWETASTGHHHPDAGSFVLISHGAYLVVDDGYNSHKRAADCNMVLVDGQGWDNEGGFDVYKGIPFDRKPEMRDVLASEGFVHGRSETAIMYHPYLKVRRVERTLVCTPAGRLLILDDLVAEEPREWTVLLQSDWPAEEVGDDLVRLRSGPGQAWVRRLPGTSEGVTVSQTETIVKANLSSSSPNWNLTTRLRTLRTTSPRLTHARFLTAIEPTSALNPMPATARTEPCDAGHEVAFDGETVLLAGVAGRISTASVTADAAAVILAHNRGIGVVAATRVVVDGRVVLEKAEPYTGVLPW